MALTTDQQLKLISRAWGKQTGYVFFPTIRGDAEDKAQRIRGYNEGPAFEWPKDRDKIIKHIEKNSDNDIYWCPSIFEKPSRRLELAMDEHALWADLDAVDPREIEEEFKPTVAWETSPGRYQALWLITSGDVQGASWPGNENQKLTYHLGADHSGWDTTQLLRLPGAANHKPEYMAENDGDPYQGKLLWHNGPRYLPDHFEDLPDIEGAKDANMATDVLEEQIATIDRLEVWGRVRLKVSKEVRDLVAARDSGGADRSDKLWQIERDLADAGCTPVEIVAVTRETIWNKFSGRNDELKRLITEASKAVAERTPEAKKQIEKDREEKPKPQNLFTMVAEAEPPVWLVKDILTEGSCGFFAGEPKSFKSWTALDLALSIATGAPFLQAFDVLNPGPVLYIQEEDPLPTLKDRLSKIAPAKTQDRVTLGDRGEDGLPTLVWAPADENEDIPPVAAMVRSTFIISDPGWQAWLDEVLDEGYGDDNESYRLVIIDTLGTTMGEVDENRAQELNNKVLKPLRELAEKHGVAVQVVHHLRKGRDNENARAGQRLLGSVALHAWSESSLYFSHGKAGSMNVETESKFAPSKRFAMENLKSKNGRGTNTWEPQVVMRADDDDVKPERPAKERKAKKTRSTNRLSPELDEAMEEIQRHYDETGEVLFPPRAGQGTRRAVCRRLGLDPDEILGTRPDRTGSGTPGRKADPNPPALQALRKLTSVKARPYTTHEIKDEVAKIQGVKPTQTIYLRAYQQLKKLFDTDIVDRVDKNWVLTEAVTSTDLDDAAIEDLIP